MRSAYRLEGVSGALAVTIDDGPNPDTTEALLEVLEVYGATANFFACGINAERFPELCARIVSAGHGLHSHGFDHPAFDTLSAEAIRLQLHRTEAALCRYRPTPAPYPLRLPFGAGIDTPAVVAAVDAWRSDAVAVQWSLCAEEWTLIDGCRTPDAVQRTCRDAVGRLASEPWDGAVVLLHDWPALPAGGGPNRPLTPSFCASLLEQYLIRIGELGLRTIRL